MAKAIMVQGTMSNAGKSLVCTGLCRAFKQDGYHVAPFKAQNMALNSFVTDEGLEMGRAQAVQAEACGIAPSVRMNPILLKPVTDVGSQVIVNGQVWGNLSAREYFAVKQSLLPGIIQAYNSLAEEFDIIVLEGAGSPAEINLKKDDLVNMGMAKLARAPVLLVGDIDCGGVFAQLYGTVALLEEEEQKMVKAAIINKFRGDVSLLEPGLTMLENLTGKPVAGVIPYLSVDIEGEDSLARPLTRKTGGTVLDIGIIDFPHLSNFTDFAVLEASPGIGVRYIRRAHELGRPDMIILPGTKNTISDLKWLREWGLEAAITELAVRGTIVFGLCGGYQMLGRHILDREGAEGGGEIEGMGLLPVHTKFSWEKRLIHTKARVINAEGAFERLTGVELEGYEIHMGQTVTEPDAKPFLLMENGREDGCVLGNVYGTYLHGFFDAKACREAVFPALACRKGAALETEVFDFKDYKERQYDLLAQSIRESLDMKLIYRILEEGL
ncbi:MAG: cobyric acid synthase [Syntrophomonadaceae bacterium]|nr:cobyric acid synthase [Syntrophomonadaceae bacterium]